MEERGIGAVCVFPENMEILEIVNLTYSGVGVNMRYQNGDEWRLSNEIPETGY